MPLSRLKAIFLERGTQTGAGHRVEVAFVDREILRGRTYNYRPDLPGFFLAPEHSESTNLRVFVVSSAVRHVRFL